MRAGSPRARLALRLTLLAVLAVLGAAACERPGAATRDVATKPVTMEHGLALGEALPTHALACGDGADALAVAPARGVQLITFATTADCSACTPHLAGLDELVAAKALRIPEVLVMWGPADEIERAVADTRGHSRRRVCTDVRGAYWDELDLLHTPVTIVARDGKVAYINDRWLSDSVHSKAFLADLERVLHDGTE